MAHSVCQPDRGRGALRPGEASIWCIWEGASGWGQHLSQSEEWTEWSRWAFPLRWAPFNPLRVSVEQKGGGRKDVIFSAACAGALVFCPHTETYTIGFPGSRAFRLRPDHTASAPVVNGRTSLSRMWMCGSCSPADPRPRHCPRSDSSKSHRWSVWGQHSNQICGVQNLFPQHPTAQIPLSHRSLAAKGFALHFPSDQGAWKQR